MADGRTGERRLNYVCIGGGDGGAGGIRDGAFDAGGDLGARWEGEREKREKNRGRNDVGEERTRRHQMIPLVAVSVAALVKE